MYTTKTIVLRNEDNASGKTLGDGIGILLCCSITGEKTKPLIIGKSKSPSGFKNINFKNLNLEYKNIKKARMTGSIFPDWFKNLDKQVIDEK